VFQKLVCQRKDGQAPRYANVAQPLPKRNPCLQGGIFSISWSAEKMDMVWQDDEPTDKPQICLSPCLTNKVIKIPLGEIGFTVPSAHGEEDNVWTVTVFDHW
jgi:hypothetical protein